MFISGKSKLNPPYTTGAPRVKNSIIFCLWINDILIPDMIDSARKKRDMLILGVLFCLSRIIWYWAGIRFMLAPLDWYWQYLPVDLLKHDLVRSLLYLHSQPPLYNLFLGIVLKFSGPCFGAAFHLFYALAGLLVVLMLYEVMVRLAVGRQVRFIMTSVFIASPSAIGYENWLFYTHAIMFFFMLAIWSAVKAMTENKSGFWHVYAWSCATVTLMRSLYHPFWLIAVLLLPVVARGVSVRAMARCAWLPVLCVAAVIVKNIVLFNTASLSSWVGMSLAYKTSDQIPRALLVIDCLNGRISPISLIRSYSEPSAYLPITGPAAPRGIDALDRLYKRPGIPNYNAALYLAVSRAYMRDTPYLLAHYPLRIMKYYCKAMGVFFLPPSVNFLWEQNEIVMKQYAAWYNGIVWLSLPAVHGRSIGFVVFFCIIIVLSTLLLTSRISIRPALRIVTFFVAFTMLWIVVTGNLLAFDETHRFRHPLEPLSMILIAAAISHYLGRLSNRLRPGKDRGSGIA